ncbi:hypothetical protein [Micromonospora chersina]|uniref:hypothetical protein n=1 Tax=Micromonospora chersina TaxID=47854 RepID=UPI00371F3FFE
MFFKAIIVVLMTVAGLAAMIWVANWPFNTPWEKDLSAEERRINAAHNRRHHRAAARMLSPALALIFGIASASLFTPAEKGSVCRCGHGCLLGPVPGRVRCADQEGAQAATGTAMNPPAQSGTHHRSWCRP